MSSIQKKRHLSSSRSHPSAPKRKKTKRQEEYHSSSSEAESENEEPITSAVQEVELEEAEQEDVPEEAEESEASGSEVDESDASDSDNSNDDDSNSDTNANDIPLGKRKKRNDPTAFATSLSKILYSKLTTTKRTDPVLSRSKTAASAVKESAEARLEAKAKAQLKSEKRAKLDTGRVKDVKGLESTEVSTEEILAEEKKLKRLAQQGVIRLFNAVLAAQMKGQEAKREQKKEGVVGIDRRGQTVNEMSKQGFLDLIAGGGKQ